MMNTTLQRLKGFTLTELIIVIVLIGIISAAIGPLIGNKFFAVAQSTQRAHWVQQAEFALFHLRQDLSLSVPNSISISEPLAGASQVVEFVASNTSSDLFAARYRNTQLAGYDRLQPNNDTSFDVFGSFSSVPNFVSINTSDAATLRLDWEAYRADNSSNGTLSAINSTANFGAENGEFRTVITLAQAHQFSGHSPYYRAYFFDGPVAFECDIANGLLNKVTSYSSLSGASLASRTAPASGAIRSRIVTDLQSCQFTLSPGTVYAPPSLRVELEIGDTLESIRLVDNITLSNGL